MIEISHAQARRLLSSALDSRQDDRRSLPEEQWAALHAHLEGCDSCRAYAERLRKLEQDLRRTARGHFDTAPRPSIRLDRVVVAGWRSRHAARRRAVSLFLMLLLAGALLGDSLGRGAFTSAPETSAAVMPVVEPGGFPAAIAYEARVGEPANGDIFLLDPGSPPENLTAHPAEDTHPAWSPDGEWLAFLSDRSSPGQPEVFVMELTGGRLVQITDEPGIRWVGPLSWSADGRSIALTGTRRDAGDQSWIYLVPVDGIGPDSRPAALAGTRGAYEPEFSPVGQRLAYVFSQGEHNGVMLHHLGTGEQVKASWTANPLTARPLPGAQFDWAPDGSGLAYIAANPLGVASLDGIVPDAGGGGDDGSQVWAVHDLNYAIGLFYEYTRNVRIARSRWPGAYRAVSWSPGGSVVYLEDLADARAQDQPGQVNLGCQMVQAREPDGAERTYSYGGLCVEGGLDAESWTADGRWLVVLGRLPNERALSIYALRMPGRDEPAAAMDDPQPGEVLRLVGDPRSASLPRVRPELAGGQARLNIDPDERRQTNLEPRPSDLSRGSDGPRGRIVYEIQNNNRSLLVGTNPDGTGGQVLLSSAGRLRCPVWSPDGRHLALVARPIDLEGQGGGEELFLLDLGGGKPRQVSRAGQSGQGRLSDYVDFGCPAWSPGDAPGGPYLAALVYDPDEWRVAVVKTDAIPTEHYALVGRPILNAPMLWAPDGRELYLAAAPLDGGQTGVFAVRLPESPSGELRVRALAQDAFPGNIMTYALSPDGRHLAVLVRPEVGSGRVQVWRMLASGVSPPRLMMELDEALSLPAIHRALARWSTENTLQVALTAGPLERYKTLLVQIDLDLYYNTAELHMVAGIEDTLRSMDWSPDGSWAVVSTEGGLWGIDLRSAALGRAGPTWLSPVPVEDLSWQ